MPETTLGQLAVDQGLLTAEQRDAALKMQAELRKQDLFMRLGEILARRALLQPAQVRGLLEKQGITLVRCRSCGKQYNARNWKLGRGSCPCSGELEPAPEEAPLSVAGNAAMQQLADGAPEKAAPPPGALRGRYFGKYPLLEELGRGAMGLVYKAWDSGLGRPLAIKVLIEGGSGEDGVQRRHQFLREVRAAAQLRHPAIVSIHEVGQNEGQGFFTMDFIDGSPLSRLIHEDGSRKPVAFENSAEPLKPVLEWVRDIALALQHAHQHGLLHCDVKPGNILIDRRNKALLSDFSSARSVRFAEDDPNARRVLGTLSYMSPEQARGAARDVGIASDVWGAGAVLYVLLTGKHPFTGSTPIDIRRAICTAPLPAPRAVEPRIPRPLEAIVIKALAKDPAKRYATARELAEDLVRYMAGEKVLAPLRNESLPSTPLWKDKRAWIAVGIGAVLIAGGLAFKWMMGKAHGGKPFYGVPEDK